MPSEFHYDHNIQVFNDLKNKFSCICFKDSSIASETFIYLLEMNVENTVIIPSHLDTESLLSPL